MASSNHMISTSPSTGLPLWDLVEVTCSDKYRTTELIVDCKGRRFVIHLSVDGLFGSPQLKEKYLFFLKVLENFELDGYTEEDFYDWAIEPFLPIFQSLELAKAAKSETSLQAYLFPEVLQYTLRAESGKLCPVPYSSRHGVPKVFGVSLPDLYCSSWRKYLPDEVRICGSDKPDYIPQEPSKCLLKDGSVAFLKLVSPGDKPQLMAELEKYKTIKDATLDGSLRISRLIGLVCDQKGCVFGLLLSYVNCHNLTLSCAVQPDTPLDLRKKWASQIQFTVGQLHKAGIVWGDAKPDNILIDNHDNAWVVDFGGGYTEGWVTKELAETKKGDLDALEKIAAFISA